ncbi:luciferin sulfotransferase isoform X2 [Cryptotermes secundus]|uniref:luciferin sulfotransferase isoform X2 n=1 Tax=Cryptotermes secundus TaxID=105785 RepID=UPI001454D778|nr:luciferin sulfotransferase isoform X2 [Cryptotermes secundus]XP_033609944.1 luciferin sulfotransferase isoform X2 [Cryptotermes secundus]
MSTASVLQDNIVNTHQDFKRPSRGGIRYTPLEGEEARKLDRMFNRQNCLIEVHPGHVLLPSKYEELGDRIRGMEVRSSDVWVVSYPRTGSTWLQEMVWCIGNDLDLERAKILQHLRTPLLELTVLMANDDGEWMRDLGNSVELVENMQSPRYIKSHLTWELLPAALSTVKPKVVYITRNPKDMCVSYYHYCTLVHNMKGSFEDFCELFLKGRVPLGPIWSHIFGFWRRRHEPNILFLTYEELKRDQEAAIRKTATFLGKTLTETEVSKLANHLSFSSMRKNPSVNLEPIMTKKNGPDFLQATELRFIRKGEVGDWKNHMTPEMTTRFDAWIEENLRGTGLSLN